MALINCPECDKEVSEAAANCPHCGHPMTAETSVRSTERSSEKAPMETTRLIFGIVSCVLFIIIFFQSCAVGIGNSLMESEEVSGSAGLLLAFCMLIAGIVAIATRKKGKGTAFVAAAFYLSGGLLAVANIGSYSDLGIWAAISFIFGGVILIGAVIYGRKLR